MTKEEKKLYKQAKHKACRPFKGLSIFTGIVFALLVCASILLSVFDNTFAAFTGDTFWVLENADPDAMYYTPDFATEEERAAYGAKICKQVEAEGAALLKNDNDALPLSEGDKISFVSNSSVNPVFGGTGSANIDASSALSFKDAFIKAGFNVNPTLWNFYLKNRHKRDSGGFISSAKTGEVPLAEYTNDVKNSIAEYGDAAIFVISRVGGEGVDLDFKELNYLELDSNEKDVLKELATMKSEGKIKKIIVLLNTANTLEVGFLRDSAYAIDACLWIGDVGMSGIEAIADIFSGATNPSGSLADTYLIDNFSSPAMQNFEATSYKGAKESGLGDSASKYMIYQEGIYVGYKYYETRYEDAVLGVGNAGEYDYYADVAYPFGYGLSYTTFAYSDMQLNYNSSSDEFEVSLTVTNTGEVEGKETVQLYIQSPYTDYDKANGVEKSAVTLAGFGKTEILAVGANERLNISIPKREFASFDAYGAKTYILDKGDYYITAATSSHNAINNILAKKGYGSQNSALIGTGYADAQDGNAELVYKWTQDSFDATTYSRSATTNYEITAQLSMADLNLYENGRQAITYLSRSDWTGTFPEGGIVLELTDQIKNDLRTVRYNKDDYPETEMPTLGKANGINLIEMRGLDYNDEKWTALLEQVTFAEMARQIGDGFHWTMPIVSVNAPGTRDENGPQGLTASLLGGDVKASAFTSEDVMAATFNVELMEEVGKCIGNDCLIAGISKLYGTGANTHRTPYGGRNFEYYSEDGFLAGKICAAETKGIEAKGVKVLVKHFALNDSEQQRIGLGVWIGEQAAREIYLKAYQATFEEADGNGVMLAYTRWGTLWSGGNYNLVTNILRNEWGCEGAIITDNALDPYLNPADLVLAGGTFFDAMLPTQYNAILKYENDPVVVSAMVEATHRNLYAVVNSAGMNTVTKDTTVKAIVPFTIVLIIWITVAVGVIFATLTTFYVIKRVKFKREYK